MDRQRADDRMVHRRLLTPRKLKGHSVIFGQGRTGSTPLMRPLNSDPEIHCDGEILQRKVLSPYHFVKAYRHRAPHPFIGIKVKISQLPKNQRIEGPRAFRERMLRDRWKLIHLKRTDIVRHAMSNRNGVAPQLLS
jgi:hypothetical protein